MVHRGGGVRSPPAPLLLEQGQAAWDHQEQLDQGGPEPTCRVSGLGFRVSGLGFKGFRVLGLNRADAAACCSAESGEQLESWRGARDDKATHHSSQMPSTNALFCGLQQQIRGERRRKMMKGSDRGVRHERKAEKAAQSVSAVKGSGTQGKEEPLHSDLAAVPNRC